MPLPPSAVARERKHLRSITVEAYQRADALWDIEARITDTKPFEVKSELTYKPANTPLHDMSVRLTVDTEFNVLDVVAVTDSAPYPGICDNIAPAYKALIGLNLMRGFRQAVRQRVGGMQGCTHITELAAVLPTATIQAFAGTIFKSWNESETKPRPIDGCHAFRADGEVVRRFYPKWYVRPAGADPRIQKESE